jgi:hypothetical protein
MMKYSLFLAASLLASAETANLNAQEAPANTMGQAQPYGSMMGYGMGGMGHGMGGMMGHGMGAPGMMMRPGMMRMMVVMMDTDGDGALSLEEVQSVHARIFKAMDVDKNARVTLEEIQQFFRGH